MFCFSLKSTYWAGKKPQKLRAHFALAEDPTSVSSTYTSCSSQPLAILAPGHLHPPSDLHGPQHLHVLPHNTLRIKIIQF